MKAIRIPEVTLLDVNGHAVPINSQEFYHSAFFENSQQPETKLTTDQLKNPSTQVSTDGKTDVNLRLAVIGLSKEEYSFHRRFSLFFFVFSR